jgi:hypothetical protein
MANGRAWRFRLKLLAVAGMLLRIQFKVDGCPYGAHCKRPVTNCGLAGSANLHSHS